VKIGYIHRAVARVAHPCDWVESRDQLVCGQMANPVIKLVVISHRETVKVRDFLGRKVG
jgi:hypothetical protein